MAISTPTDIAGAQATGSSATVSVATGSFTPTGDALLLVYFTGIYNAGSGGPYGLSVSADGFGTLSWTEVADKGSGGAGSYARTWCAWAIAPSSPSAGTVTIAFTGEASRYAVGCLEVATGYDATTPITTTGVAEATTSTLSVTLGATPAATSAVIGVVTSHTHTGDITPGTDFTELSDFGIGGGQQVKAQTQYDIAAADTTVDWSGLGTTKNTAIGFEVAEAAAASGGASLVGGSRLVG